MNTRNHFKSGFLRVALMLILAVMTFPIKAWADEVKYIDEDGVEKTVDAIVLTGTETELGQQAEHDRTQVIETWYVCTTPASDNGGKGLCYNSGLIIKGHVRLILADGCKMTVENNNNAAIQGGDNANFKSMLSIYDQSNDMMTRGAIAVKGGTGIYFKNGNFIVNGGIVNVIAQTDYGTNVRGHVIINGGQVSVNGGSNRYGIYAWGDIILGWRNTTDYIQASSYYTYNFNNKYAFKTAEGKAFVYEGGTLSGGTTLNDGQIGAIAGKRLTPDLWGITSGNDGSETKPYTITNTAGLDLLAKMVNGTDSYSRNEFSGKYFVLGNDISYTHKQIGETGADTENNYTAIGGYNSNFKGTFDGQGHTVSGIRIYKGGSDDGDCYQGLFGNIVGGTVRHVTLDDAQITGYDFTGGIVGYNNEGNITDCHVTENVCISDQQNTSHHGGIMGNNGGSVSGCTSKAKIKTNSSSCFEFGGIAGYNNSNGTMKDCLYLGSEVEGDIHVGAVAGMNDGSIIINCYYTNEDFFGQVSPGTPPENNAIGDNSGSVTNTGLARIVTLGEGVTLNGTATDYGPASPYTSDVRITSYATAADQPGFALKLETVSGTTTTTTYYSTSGATVAFGYSGTVPEGGIVDYTATKTTGGADVTSTVLSGSTLTMPDYDVTITAAIRRTAYAVLSEDGKTLTFKYEVHTVTGDKEWDVSDTRTSTPGWGDQCSSITKVIFDGSFADARPKSCSQWFLGCMNLTAITGLNNLNTSKVTDMCRMFNDCNSLTSLDLSNFNTSNVGVMDYMFSGCSSLTSITFGEQFSTSNVGNMRDMFSYCTKLESLDLSGFDTSLSNDNDYLNSVFNNCSSLASLIIGSGFTIGSTTKTTDMFSGCTALANDTLTVKGTTAPTINKDIFSVFTYGTLFTDLTTSNLGVTENSTGDDAGYFTWKGGTFLAHNNRVSYLDENGARQFKDNVTRITSSNNGAPYSDGWYFVTGDVDIHGQLNFTGDAHIILCDGAKMTVYNTNGHAIYVSEASIAIYGQSTATETMGSLTAKGSGSGIYSYSPNGGSCITINGGQVTATCTGDGFGIEAYSNIGNAQINLGWTNADDFIKSSSYRVRTGGSVKTAAGKRFIAYDADTGTAANCIIGDASSTTATAIGTDISLDDATAAKTIAGKTLRPLDGYTVSTTDGNISLKDGTTTKAPDFTIGTIPYYIYKASTTEAPVSVPLDVSVADYGQDGVELTGSNVPVDVTIDSNTATFNMPAEDVTISGMNYYNTAVDYLTWDDTKKKLVEATTPTDTKVYILTGGGDATLSGGWYIAKGEVTYTGGLTLTGEIHLILGDGATLTVGNSEQTIGSYNYKVGIYATEDFFVYGQKESSGTLNVTDDDNYYGIYNDGKDITINSGKIVAKTDGGACIYSINHNLTINGGDITANSPSGTAILGDFVNINDGKVMAEGVGGIRSFNTLSITGGTVEATATSIGIHVSNDITISGGQVKAIGGTSSVDAGIRSFEGDIHLGWRNADDFIQASSYYVSSSNSVKIPAGKSFYYTSGDNMTFLGNATNDYVFGAEGNATLGDIANKKLMPALPIDASQPYFMRTFDGNWKPIGGGKTFLPGGYDLAKGVVTLKEVAGAPDGLPVIVGPEDEQHPFAQYFVVGASGDEVKTIQEDYDNVVKNMGDRFVITDGTKTLSEILEGIENVDASEAIVLMLVNGKFTTVDVSADDLGKKTKAGLLLFVLSKWEFMQIEPSNSAVATNGNANTRTIGIGEGETTGIEAVQTTPDPSLLRRGNDGGDWYDLQGRKISKPTKKGIYIFNNKKVKI